ncbi:MAG: hypothetical protein P8Y23_10510 [Candidatus Lokiarchaeota archaeon]|jgi:hypothetical protein
MVKRFVGYILLGVAGANALVTTITTLSLIRLFSLLGISAFEMKLVMGQTIIITAVPVFILIISAIVIFIKSYQKDRMRIKRKGPSISTLIDRMNRSFVDKVEGTIHIESIKKPNDNEDDEAYMLKLNLSDELSSIKIIIKGANPLKIFNSIKDEAYIEFRNLPVQFNPESNEKELLFTQKSSFKVLYT